MDEAGAYQANLKTMWARTHSRRVVRRTAVIAGLAP